MINFLSFRIRMSTFLLATAPRASRGSIRMDKQIAHNHTGTYMKLSLIGWIKGLAVIEILSFRRKKTYYFRKDKTRMMKTIKAKLHILDDKTFETKTNINLAILVFLDEITMGLKQMPSINIAYGEIVSRTRLLNLSCLKYAST